MNKKDLRFPFNKMPKWLLLFIFWPYVIIMAPIGIILVGFPEFQADALYEWSRLKKLD